MRASFALPAILLFICSCAGVHSGNGLEPAVLVARNSSGEDIASFTLKTAGRTGTTHHRHGTIAPVPRGSSQIYRRPASAPPLPRKMTIEWVTNRCRTFRKVISLNGISTSGMNPGQATLVFEILPDALLNVYVE